MRKVIAICVLISYMLCAFSTSISFHHCAGELKYITIGKDKDHEIKCCKGEKNMPDDCCNSNTISFKKGEDKAQPFLIIKLFQFEPTIIEAFVPVIVKHTVTVFDKWIPLFRPPPNRTGSLPLYIIHSVFRI